MKAKMISSEVSWARFERGAHHFYPHSIDQTGHPGPPRCKGAGKNRLCGMLRKTKIKTLRNTTNLDHKHRAIHLHKSIM